MRASDHVPSDEGLSSLVESDCGGVEGMTGGWGTVGPRLAVLGVIVVPGPRVSLQSAKMAKLYFESSALHTCNKTL